MIILDVSPVPLSVRTSALLRSTRTPVTMGSSPS